MFDDVEEMKPDDPKDQELHYYYNREDRIAKAPANVQEYYNGGMRPVRGIKVFFLKQNRWIFFALIIFVAFTWGYTGFNKTRAFISVDGINFELSAFLYEEQIYSSIQIKPGKKYKYTVPVDIKAEFFLIGSDNQVFERQLHSLVYSDGIQYIRAKYTDFDIVRVDVILNVNGHEKEISADVKR